MTLDTGTLPVVAHDRLEPTYKPDKAAGGLRAVYTAGGRSGLPTGLHGFNGLLATETSVSLRLSGKALGNAYSCGISNATLPELCDRLASTGLVVVTPDQLRGGTVRRADPFADVQTDDLDGFAAALTVVGRTSGNGTRTTGRGERVTLYSKLPNGLGMLRTYGKDRELSLAKNREFCTLYPAAVEAVQGRHRAELATQSYAASRRVASIAEGVPTLADLLDSPRTPVSDALDALLDTWTGRRRAVRSLPSLPASLDAMLAQPHASPSADANNLLVTLLADFCHGDLEACKAAVRHRYGTSHAFRLYPGLQAACEAYRSMNHGEAVHAFAHDTLAEYADRIRAREASDDR